jgi:putative endonuclease
MEGVRWLLGTLGRLLAPDPRHAAARLGRRGERVAARRLRRVGYRILARNLRTPAGEIDVLALHEGALVIVEVKSGVGGTRARLEGRLRGAQCRRLRAAGIWLRRRPALRRYRLRLDLVTVTFGERRAVVTIRRGIGGA